MDDRDAPAGKIAVGPHGETYIEPDEAALYEITAPVIDTRGHEVEAGDRMEARWVTIGPGDEPQVAVASGIVFFQSVGFEIDGEVDYELVLSTPDPGDLLEYVDELEDGDHTVRPI